MHRSGQRSRLNEFACVTLKSLEQSACRANCIRRIAFVLPKILRNAPSSHHPLPRLRQSHFTLLLWLAAAADDEVRTPRVSRSSSCEAPAGRLLPPLTTA